MSKAHRYWLLRLVASGFAAMLVAAGAHATDGYFQDGYGARQKALAGSGAADGRDATTISLNPAGLVNVPNETAWSISINKVDRAVTGSSPVDAFFVESNDRHLPIISSAASLRLTGNPFFDVIGYSLYTNGSLGTDYPAITRMGCQTPGIYCGGAAGLTLQQWYLSLAVAKSFGSISYRPA